MGCCGRRSRVPVQNDPAPCKILEQGGAGLKLWLANTGSGFRVVVKNGSGNLVDLQALLANYGCSGPMARMLSNNLDRIISAAKKDPTAFRKHSSGVSLVQLLRTADRVRKPERRTYAKTR